MDELFLKRMQNLSVPGHAFVDRTNRVIRKTFKNDPDYQCGTLYDWDMNPLDSECEFKFEKHRTYTAEGYSVDYFIHFMPDYNPESLFKDFHYRADGKERLGFYIEIFDRSKNKNELWMIVGKDDRVALDRYLAFKCNWCLEWMVGNEVHSKVCVVRESIADNVREWETTISMMGTNVGGIISVILPTSAEVKTIDFGTRLMITDNEITPRCFEVSDMKDTIPLGVTKLFLSRSKFNAHTDYFGKISNQNLSSFKFKAIPEDLPEDYGGKDHCICDCMVSGLNFTPSEPSSISQRPKLECSVDVIYVNGSPVNIDLNPTTADVEWHYFVDGEEYTKTELADYFLIEHTGKGIFVKAINKIMVKYILKVSVVSRDKKYYSSVELEVKA